MNLEKPLLVVFGGPNGSGKSSFTNKLFGEESNLPKTYINADEIAKQFNLNSREAAMEAARRRQACLDKGESFVMETVMSTPEKIDLMIEAKAKSYEVILFYVTTGSARINLIRVKNRVAQGGHDVPPDKIILRYQRSMSLLSQALTVVDQAYVYDNTGIEPIPVIMKVDQTISKLEDAPGWKTRYKNIRKEVKEIKSRLSGITNIGAAPYIGFSNINYIDEREEFKQKAKMILFTDQYWTSETDKKVVAGLLAAGYKEERIKNALRELSPFTVGKIADYHIDKIIAKARKSLK